MTETEFSSGDELVLGEQEQLKLGEVSPLAQVEAMILQAQEERQQVLEQLKQDQSEIEHLRYQLNEYQRKCHDLSQQLAKTQAEKEKLLSLSRDLQETIADKNQETKILLSLIENEQKNRQYLQETINNVTAISSHFGQKIVDIGQEFKLTQEERKLIYNYNNKIEDLEIEITQAVMDQDSIEKGREGAEYLAKFIKHRCGLYWVITTQYGFYLVPNYNKKFNTHQLNSMRQLFELKGYEEGGNPNNFELEKPAKVSCTESREEWILAENDKGILNFKAIVI